MSVEEGEGPAGGVQGAMRLERSRDYQMGYTEGYWAATQNLAKLVGVIQNPPPILLDARSIDPKFLASLGLQARSAPEASSPEGSKPPSPIPSPSNPNGDQP